jgi:flavodoxin
MKIECIVFSLTGHTKAVAEKVWNKLLESGHEVGFSIIEPEGKLDLKSRNSGDQAYSRSERL